MICRPRRRYAYRLAEIMGRLDVDAMLAEMTEAQFREWRGFHRLEPAGQPAEDARHAMRCAIAAGGRAPWTYRYKPQLGDAAAGGGAGGAGSSTAANGTGVVRQPPEEMKRALRG